MKIDGHIFDTIILAGGKNSRMQGKFKGSLTYRDEIFLERIMKGIQDGTGQIFLSCAEPGQVRDIPEGCRVIYDTFKEVGPIAGLISGLRESESDYAAVCACDMPFISKKLYAYIWNKGLELSGGEAPDVILPHTTDHFHPLAALYYRDILPHLEEAAAKGQKKLMQIIKTLHYVSVDLEPLSQMELEVTNINTVQELKELELMTQTIANQL